MKTPLPKMPLFVPISEDDLHAWVDEVLPSERRQHVAQYLQAHPQVARRVAQWQAQRTQLRTTLAPIGDEALPVELNLRRMVAVRQTERHAVYGRGGDGWTGWFSSWNVVPRAMATTAALVLCLGAGLGAGLGFMGGWALRALHDAGAADGAAGLIALGQDAAASYKVYAPDRLHPVEIRAENRALLAAWAAAHTGKRLTIPELDKIGYRFMGGRVLATAYGAAVLLMYDDDKNEPASRLVMLARPMKNPLPNLTGHAADNRMQPVGSDGIHGFVWRDGNLGYSLVGALASETLHPLADEVRRQIRQVGL